MFGFLKLFVVLAGLTVAALACGGAGDEGTAPTGTVLGVSVSPVESLPGDEACSPEVYLVQSGDTLSEIALEFNVPVEAIAEASDLSDPDALEVGQELTVPCVTSEVAPTETTPTPAT